jgi:hypothetical protein
MSIKGFSQEKEIKVSFTVNGKSVKNMQYYIIDGSNAYLQEYKNSNILLKNSLTNDTSLLLIYKKHKVLIPIIRSNEVQYINVYYDNRIFNNLIRKKYKRPFFKHLFKKDYLIDLGLDDVYTTFKLKKKYKLID